MPSCFDCKWRDGTRCLSHEAAQAELKRPLPPPPTGACTVAIVDSYFNKIKSGMRVLEIGCGTWSKLRDHCLKVGAHYEGLDVQKEYYGIPCIATRIENLAELSFRDEEFDLVIGNQTMEHWGEYGCHTQWGLYQCFRVLKKNGFLFMNVPIHFHGTKNFVHGRLTAIKELLLLFSTQIEFESWGSPTAPLAEYHPHPRFWGLKNKPAYVLDIQAKKDKPLPKNLDNTTILKGKLSRLVQYSFSYNVYRFVEKMRAWI